MNKVINELLKENFSYRPERISLSEKKIEGNIQAGRRFGGRFFIGSGSGQVQGYLYSTNPRVSCEPEYFIGFRAEIAFAVRTEGLADGDVLDGEFVICAPSGEYELPYCLHVVGAADGGGELPLQMTEEEFARLAKEDFARAYALFSSRQFARTAASWGASCLPLYEGLAAQGLSYHSLEQFLVGLGQKEPVRIGLSNDHIYRNNPGENEREEVQLTKNTWGFAEISASSDAPFLQVERSKLTTEDFVGSSCGLGVIIRRDRLHAGRNFGRIRIASECREQSCTVEIRCTPLAAPNRNLHRRRQEILRLMGAYIDFRAGRTGKKEWAGISAACLENIKKTGGEDIFFDLYGAYLLFETGDIVAAQTAVSRIEERKAELADPARRACLLYLTALGNGQREYREYVQQGIRDLYLADQENWILQWLMLRVGENFYRGDSERLDALRRQYICGCASPVLYLEGWEILKREPLMLRSLEDYEIHLLAFLAKEKLLNREICGQAAQLAARFPSFHPLLYRVLEQCFRLFPSRGLLTAICSILLKGRKGEAKYAPWYELGVKQDIRLAGMYEYFAQTAQDLNVRLLPQAVQMYFSYNNTLAYDKKAALYANILRARTRDSQTFETYRPAMERFLEEQLQEGRINENLALLYDGLLTRRMLGDHLAGGISKVLFAHEIVCTDPQIRQVIAVHGQLAQEQRVPLCQGRACVQICTSDCRILLEDKNGVRYADPSLFSVKKMLTRTDFEDFCRSREQVSAGLLLHDLDGARVTGENVRLYVKLPGLAGLRTDFRRQAEEMLLAYFIGQPQDAHLQEFLCLADLKRLAARSMRDLAELLVSAGLMEQALELVRQNGPERVDARTLVRLCSYLVQAGEQERNEELLQLCARCFGLGVYDEAVLAYLLRWYEGPVGIMKALWQAGQDFLLDGFSLEEKILASVLYMRCRMEQTEPVFAAYIKKQGSAGLCRAYVIWMSYCYFVREMDVAQPVFQYMEQNILGQLQAPDICQLAMLRYYCLADRTSAAQQKWLVRLLEKYTSRGMYFACYRRLPSRILRQFDLHDKYILEYRADPRDYVAIHYRLNGQKEQTLPMNHICHGIFAKTFTLFYQDKLEWYWSVENKNGFSRTEAQTILCKHRSPRGSAGRYELVNLLAEAQDKRDQKQTEEIRRQYIGQQYLVDELFQIQ